jgi:hypothetical protein
MDAGKGLGVGTWIEGTSLCMWILEALNPPPPPPPPPTHTHTLFWFRQKQPWRPQEKEGKGSPMSCMHAVAHVGRCFCLGGGGGKLHSLATGTPAFSFWKNLEPPLPPSYAPTYNACTVHSSESLACQFNLAGLHSCSLDVVAILQPPIQYFMYDVTREQYRKWIKQYCSWQAPTWSGREWHTPAMPQTSWLSWLLHATTASRRGWLLTLIGANYDIVSVLIHASGP